MKSITGDDPDLSGSYDGKKVIGYAWIHKNKPPKNSLMNYVTYSATVAKLRGDLALSSTLWLFRNDLSLRAKRLR